MLFMKAHVNHHCYVNNKIRYIFESMGDAAILDGQNAELFTSHFCCICLAVKVSNAVKERMLYRMTLFRDKANSSYVFAVTYFLKTCIQVNSMQHLELVLRLFVYLSYIVFEKTVQRYGLCTEI